MSTFQFSCKVKSVKKQYQGGKTGSQIESELFLLIPEQSTQADRFLDIWKPTDKFKKPETPVILDPPVDASGIVQVCNPDQYSDGKFYLHVMTPRLESKLALFIGRSVMVQVVDEESSDAQDSD